jgi:hypothetical protein
MRGIYDVHHGVVLKWHGIYVPRMVLFACSADGTGKLPPLFIGID